MSLVDRYIAEVGRHLPEKDRADIEAEIRSTLEDVIEEKNADVTVVLKEFGDPSSLAEKYSQSKRYVIGPLWYDGYIETLKRVLYTALPIFMTVTFLVSLANEPGSVVGSFLRAAGNTFGVGLQICFWVTLVFILLERGDVNPDEHYSNHKREWTLDQLPAMPKKRQIDVGEVISSIALVIGGAGLIALSPRILSIQNNGESIPFLHPNLWDVWLPVFFVLMGLTMIHELLKLKIGNWTRALTITNVILGFVSIVYIIALITTQQVFNPAFLAGAGSRFTATWSTWTVNITAAVIISIYVWDMVESVRLAKVFEKQNK